MRCRQVLLDPQQVDCRGRGGGAEGLASHLAAEALLLQVEEPGGPLHVGERLGAGFLQPLEHLAAGERPFELADELFQVMGDDPVQVDQVAVDVVQHLDVGRVAGKEHRRATGEDLHIAAMGWEPAQQQVDEAAFAADPGNDGSHEALSSLALPGALMGGSRPSRY